MGERDFRSTSCHWIWQREREREREESCCGDSAWMVRVHHVGYTVYISSLVCSLLCCCLMLGNIKWWIGRRSAIDPLGAIFGAHVEKLSTRRALYISLYVWHSSHGAFCDATTNSCSTLCLILLDVVAIAVAVHAGLRNPLVNDEWNGTHTHTKRCGDGSRVGSGRRRTVEVAEEEASEKKRGWQRERESRESIETAGAKWIVL